MKEQTVFDRAKERKGIGDVLGVKAHPVNHYRLKECPFCQGAFTFSFTDEYFKCWKVRCGMSGDVITLAAELWGCTPLEAARDLAGEHGDEPKREWKPRERPTASAAPDRKRQDTIADILAGAIPARGTIVENYLRSRGLAIDAIDPALDHLFFNPHAVYAEADDERDRPVIRYPAMVVRVVRGAMETGGLHCTYLKPDGSRKADVLHPKKMWGPQGDARGPGGLLLIPPKRGALLVTAEGIENALTVAAGRSAGAFAAGSLDRLQGGMALDRWGKADWWKPAPNEAKPAATIRHEGPVLIVVDGDMSPIVIAKGKPWQRAVSSRQRAQACGLLAAYWWRKAGATSVQIVRPVKADANDVLREGAA